MNDLLSTSRPIPVSPSPEAQELSQSCFDPSFRDRFREQCAAITTPESRTQLEGALRSLPAESPLATETSGVLGREEAIARNPSMYSKEELFEHQLSREKVENQLRSIGTARTVVEPLAESLRQTEADGQQFMKLIEGWDDGRRTVEANVSPGRESVRLGRTSTQPEVLFQDAGKENSPGSYYPDTDTISLPPHLSSNIGAKEYGCMVSHELDHRRGFMEQMAHERMIDCFDRNGIPIPEDRPRSVSEVPSYIQIYNGEQVVASALERHQGQITPELLRDLPGGDLYIERANTYNGPNAKEVKHDLLNDANWNGFVMSGAKDYFSARDYPGTTLAERAEPGVRQAIDDKVSEVTRAYSAARWNSSERPSE